MQLPQNHPAFLEHRRTSLVHTITLIINNLPNTTLNNLDTTSQAWASIIRPFFFSPAQGIIREYEGEGRGEVDLRITVYHRVFAYTFPACFQECILLCVEA
jgi:hypothetical protein